MKSKVFGVAILALLFIATPIFCFGANNSPAWIKNPPQSLNSTYSFKVVESDAGSDLTSAREHSRKELTRSIAREFNIKISDSFESQSITEYDGRKTTFSGKDIYTLNIESKDENVQVYYERVDEYYTIERIGGHKVFRLYTLYAVARPDVSVPQFDNFEKTDKYGVRGVLRSMIVPGWGQFYKGSKTKGAIILGSTAALAGGIIATESMRASYVQKMEQTYNVKDIIFYNDKAKSMETARNLCIGGVAALYLYNLIDAAAAGGATRVKVSKVALLPYADTRSQGVALTYKF